jgi:ubiquitin-associated SH3 domain-containing protein
MINPMMNAMMTTGDEISEAQLKEATHELIVYATPVGELADQINAYLERARIECGENAAHHYMPHITLTGFFHDRAASIPMYFASLSAAVAQARLIRPAPILRITEMRLGEQFQGLLIESPWLKQLAANFSRMTLSVTRTSAVRLKVDLHLSLAYQFPPEQAEHLARLAREMVDITAPVSWQLRFYEREANGQWLLHGLWKLD